eukprot:scaffold529_cov308-Pinguiococcus_pyrenoidosus.AAC.43
MGVDWSDRCRSRPTATRTPSYPPWRFENGCADHLETATEAAAAERKGRDRAATVVVLEHYELDPAAVAAAQELQRRQLPSLSISSPTTKSVVSRSATAAAVPSASALGLWTEGHPGTSAAESGAANTQAARASKMEAAEATPPLLASAAAPGWPGRRPPPAGSVMPLGKGRDNER